MKNNISKFITAFTLLVLFFVIICPAESHAQANGFVFSKENGKDYMYRFSLEGPAELTGRQLVDEKSRGFFTGNHMTFANRPWIFSFRWWRSQSLFLCRIDTATGEETPIETTSAGNGKTAGLSYDKSLNSLFVMTYNIRPRWTETILKRVSLNSKGCRTVNFLTLKDTCTFITFTISADGFGYSVNTRGELKRINLSTGSTDIVRKLKGKIINGKIMPYSDFNPVNGMLYLLIMPDSLHTSLAEIDIKTGKSKIAARWNGAYTSLAISGNVYPPPLAAPDLISPLGHLDNFEPLLQWKPVEGATGYFLNYEKYYPGVGGAWWWTKDTTETSYKVEKDEFDNSFPNYWWVAAYDSTGLGYFSYTAKVGKYVDNPEEDK